MEIGEISSVISCFTSFWTNLVIEDLIYSFHLKCWDKVCKTKKLYVLIFNSPKHFRDLVGFVDLATASKADRRCFPVVLHLFAQQLVDVGKNTAVLQLPGRIIDSNVITALNSRNICAIPESRSVDDETYWEITRGNGSKEATRQQIRITGKLPGSPGQMLPALLPPPRILAF